MSSTASKNNNKLRILVVDDEPDILLTLNAVLSGQGHYVKTFDNPKEALSHLITSSNEVTPYDLVITDHRMPNSGMSGIDLAKQVKEHNARTGRKTKVFLMSASFNVSSSLPDEFVEALKPQIIDEFIQKPIANDKLLDITNRSFFLP